MRHVLEALQVVLYWLIEKVIGVHPHLRDAERALAAVTRRADGYDRLFGNVASAQIADTRLRAFDASYATDHVERLLRENQRLRERLEDDTPAYPRIIGCNDGSD